MDLTNYFSKLSHIAPCLRLLLNDDVRENNEMYPGTSIVSTRISGELFLKQWNIKFFLD
jgi:hypothetical protein